MKVEGDGGLRSVPSAVLVTAVAEMAILRALELAGNRLLGMRSRSLRGPLRTVPPWMIHTRVPVETHEIDRLLPHAWDVPRSLGLPSFLIDVLDRHVRILLAAGIAFDRGDLQKSLAQLTDREVPLPWLDACGGGSVQGANSAG